MSAALRTSRSELSDVIIRHEVVDRSRHLARCFLRFVLPALIFCWGSSPGVQQGILSAAEAADQPSWAQIRADLRQAGKLYQSGQFQDAADLVKAVQSRLTTLSATTAAEQAEQKAVYRSLQKAQTLLELEGISLPQVAKPSTVSRSGISYTKQIAPLLEKRCGSCHINDTKGELSMATHADLMRGGSAGRAVRSRRANASLIVRRIRAGEMPPDNPSVTKSELKLLSSWINQGARFNGKVEQSRVKPADKTDRPLSPEIDGSVSFSNQIAPLLAAQCVACHGSNNPRNNLSLSSFRRMERGGDGGPLWDLQKPADSLLVKKLRGTADGQRMPLNRPAWSEAQIATVLRWISEGALFDGDSPAQSVEDLALVSKLRNATAAELSSERERLAIQNWQLVFPSHRPDLVKSEHFLLVGYVSEKRLTKIAELAESLRTRIDRILQLSSQAQARKGRITIFLVRDSYEYSEFAQMVEKRAVPVSWRGHARTAGLDAYVVQLLPKSEQRDGQFDAELCRGIVGAMLQLTGDLPDWFIVGAANAVAAKVAPRSSLAKRLSQELPSVVARMDSPEELLKSKLSPESQEVAAAGLLQAMLKNGRRFGQMLQDVEGGQPFSEAILQRLGQPMEAIAENWWKTLAN